MKEAFWGVLVIMLGLFGIVVINLFQKVTIDNDKVYYVIKETTEASMYDAVDLARYRLTGKLRIVEDKFVENLTRRFAENISAGNYTLVINDINENPPKVSLVVGSSITSLKGEKFNITNRIDGILETKYTIEEIKEFLNITEEEWNNIISPDGEDKKDYCEMFISSDEYECTPKDIKFGSFGDAKVDVTACHFDAPKTNVPIDVTYYTCDCGKWTEQKETIYTSGLKYSDNINYTWTFNKVGEFRTINESITKKTKLNICTTSIGIMVPKDLRIKEPSNDNSEYVPCNTGIRIPIEKEIVLHGSYNPLNASNRILKWDKNNDYITLSSSNGFISLNSFSKSYVTAKNIGTTNVVATSTLGQTSNCNITIWDGSVDSLMCENMELNVNESKNIEYSYEPYNATKIDFTYSVENTNIGTVKESTITGVKAGTTNIKVTSPDGKTATCSLTVKASSSGGTTTTNAGECGCTFSEYVRTYEENERCLIRGYSNKCLKWKIKYIDVYEDVYYPGRKIITKYEGNDPDNGQYYCIKIKKCETSKAPCKVEPLDC